MPLTLTYTTSRHPVVDTTMEVPVPSASDPVGFGAAWLSSFHRQLTVQSNLRAAQASRGDGRIISFAGDGTGNFTPEEDGIDALTTVVGAGGYLLRDGAERSIETYNGLGQLVAISQSHGPWLTLIYSTASTPPNVAPALGYLLTVWDNFGRSLQFGYTLPAGSIAATGGLVTHVTDPAGQVTSVSYDTNGNLMTLDWADSAVRGFLYENADLPWALTGIVDENSSRNATVGYDTFGRAINSSLAGGVNSYSVSYTTPPRVGVTEVLYSNVPLIVDYIERLLPSGTVVTMPNGTSSGIGASAPLGYPLLTSQSQPAGSGCAASSKSYTFDANSNATGITDFNGGLSCYASDAARNLEVTHVEGLANTASCGDVTPVNAALPTGSRKTSTAWHPDWRLEAKKAEPGRLTTSVYNGQPDPSAGNAVASCAPSGALLPDGKPIAVLCKTVEQATTDADGHLGFSASLQSGVPARVNSWTYNQYGQVLTAKGPRTDVNDTTTYAYYPDTTADHTMGDLQTLTNAVGQVTTYTKYNKHGQLLESTDPNGVVTVNTYDLRQRLLTTSVGGQMTTNTYDPVGQLLNVTSPDGSWIGYEYDPAHRQVAVKDSLGNRIEYTLDNAGNKTAENVKDPNGALKRTLARSIDALGRVQQTTGRE